MLTYPMFVDGKTREPAGGEWFPTDAPYRGMPWARIAKGSQSDVDAAVEAAHRALTSGPWPDLTASGRGALLRRLVVQAWTACPKWNAPSGS